MNINIMSLLFVRQVIFSCYILLRNLLIFMAVDKVSPY